MKRRIESYLQYLELANRSENTIRSYRGYLLDFARFAKVLDVENIERYLVVLHQREFSKASTRRALATLKSFGRWMVDEGLLRENPVEAFRGPRGYRRIKERISEGEARQLCEAASRTRFPERDRLLVELLYGSGLRADEVANLRADDVLGGDLLLVSTGKGDKQRQVLLTDFAQHALQIYLRKRKRILQKRIGKGDERKVTGLFFGLNGGQIDALTSRSVHRRVVEIAKSTRTPWVSPHDLRRAFATHMDEHGAPHIVISRLLGHANLSTTEWYIGAASPERLKKVYARVRDNRPETWEHPA